MSPSPLDPWPPEALLDAYPEPARELAERLRAVVRATMPEVAERVRPGWRIIGYDVPVGRRSIYFGWIMPEVVHVHLGFRFGVLMDDPEGLLQGDAKLARWLTYTPGDAIDGRRLRPLILEGARVAGWSAAERQARLLDRSLVGGR